MEKKEWKKLLWLAILVSLGLGLGFGWRTGQVFGSVIGIFAGVGFVFFAAAIFGVSLYGGFKALNISHTFGVVAGLLILMGIVMGLTFADALTLLLKLPTK